MPRVQFTIAEMSFDQTATKLAKVKVKLRKELHELRREAQEYVAIVAIL